MDFNPYEAPKHGDQAHPIPGERRRRWWKRICLRSFGVFVLITLSVPIIDKVLLSYNVQTWGTGVLALLSLVSLGGLTVAMIAGIGWMLSFRSPSQ